MEHLETWTPGTIKPPAAQVCFEVMEQHKKFRNIFQDQKYSSVATVSIRVDDMQRAETENWRPAAPAKYGDSLRYNQFAEVESVLKHHEGEARSWTTSGETWIPLLYESSFAA